MEDRNIYIGQVSIYNMPKVGPDLIKIRKIRNVLKKNPKGLWIREIARKAKLSKSTVHKYINTYMKKEIEEIMRGKGNFIRIVRLRK